MKGIRVHQTGDSSVLRQEKDLAIPAIGDRDVLVKVEYAGVNFIDIYQREGVYPMPLPFTAGREGSGTVVGVGPHVRPTTDFNIGDRVAVFTQGTMAEYVSAAASGVAKLPPSVSTQSGAAITLQGLTAWTMVRDAHRVEAGQVVLVQAAAGGTGGLLVQMCKHLGATVIGTVSTQQKAQVARKHGCDHVILYKDVNVEREVDHLTDGEGCHAVLSGVGAATFEADLACTRRKGTLVSYGNSSGVVSSFGILALSKRNVKLVRPTLANYITERDEFEERWQELSGLVSSGAVKLELGGMYTLDTLGRAQDDLASQLTTGKLLVKID
ncbi:putative quinone oxidoreductase [Metarhizium anisopliae]|nr:putative quinone oxidoreductase [Metarhizium anisopliae]